MKIIKKFTNKIIAGFLSLTMLITGALSLGTMKKHTASADATIMAQPFNVNTVYEFARAMGIYMRLEENTTSFLFVDSQLFLELTVSVDTNPNLLYDTAFLTGLADGLYEQLFGEAPGDADYTVQDVLDWVDLEVIVNIYSINASTYMNLAGDRFSAGNLSSFNRGMNEVIGYSFDIGNNPVYAAILNLPNSSFYRMLCTLQSLKDFQVFVFPSVNIVVSDNAALIIWAWLGGCSFTEGVYWSE